MRVAVVIVFALVALAAGAADARKKLDEKLQGCTANIVERYAPRPLAALDGKTCGELQDQGAALYCAGHWIGCCRQMPVGDWICDQVNFTAHPEEPRGVVVPPDQIEPVEATQ